MELAQLTVRIANLEKLLEQPRERGLALTPPTTKSQVDDLLKQIESLKKINGDLEAKVKELQNVNASILDKADHNRIDVLNILSQKRIDEFVEELLSNDSTNIAYLPDFVERQLYRNTLNITFKLLNKLFNTTSVSFIGHKLKLDIEPLKESEVRTV